LEVVGRDDGGVDEFVDVEVVDEFGEEGDAGFYFGGFLEYGLSIYF